MPVYVPFFVLAGVCTFWPKPRWFDKVDWYVARWWAGCVAFCVVFWIGMVWLIEWMIP